MIHYQYHRPFMYPFQQRILDSLVRYLIVIAATKVGKTTTMIVWLFEEALKCKPNQNVWWVAPTLGQARIAYNRMKNYINDKDFYKSNDTHLIIRLANGAIIHFKTADKPDNLYGEDVFAVVFDEFTRGRESAWVALRTTITATGGKVRFIGNAKEKKNWGNKLAMKAKSGEDKNYEYVKITAYDAAAEGMKTKDGRPLMEEIEEAKRDLPQSAFKALYLAEATDDGSNPFGLDFIAQCCVPDISTEPSICYGVDLARKVDWVSIMGLDKLARVSHYHTFTKIGWRQTIETIRMLPVKPTAIDSTGVGDVVVAELEPYHSQLEPVIFTPASKQMLLEGLAVGIQSRKVIIPDDGNVVNGTGRIRHQLEQMEITYTRTGVKYSAPEGDHDDDVVSLALAYHKYKTAVHMTGEISIW